MRNLLAEFRSHPTATIIGFREHIFTGAVSSIASYMALQARLAHISRTSRADLWVDLWVHPLAGGLLRHTDPARPRRPPRRPTPLRPPGRVR